MRTFRVNYLTHNNYSTYNCWQRVFSIIVPTYVDYVKRPHTLFRTVQTLREVGIKARFLGLDALSYPLKLDSAKGISSCSGCIFSHAEPGNSAS